MNSIIHFDQQLFFFINHKCHIAFLNDIMPYWRSMYFWIPLYAFFVTYIVEKFGKKGWIYLLALALTVGVADTVSSKFIKKSVQRVRPCNDDQLKTQVKLLVRCGSGYSFPSSHATNHFAVAVFVIFTFAIRKKWLKWALIAWASSVALGQVYVGIHYPFDILCGGILGSFIGWGIAFLYKKYGRANSILQVK